MPSLTSWSTSLRLWVLVACLISQGAALQAQANPVADFQARLKALENEGLQAAQKGDWKAALKALGLAQRMAYLDPKAIYNLALAHQRSGDLGGAAVWFRTYLATAQDGPRAQAVRLELSHLCEALEERARRSLTEAEALALRLPATRSRPKAHSLQRAAFDWILHYAHASDDVASAEALQERIHLYLPEEPGLDWETSTSHATMGLHTYTAALDVPKAEALRARIAGIGANPRLDGDMALMHTRLGHPAEAMAWLKGYKKADDLDKTRVRDELLDGLRGAMGVSQIEDFCKRLLKTKEFEAPSFFITVECAEWAYWQGEGRVARQLAQSALDYYHRYSHDGTTDESSGRFDRTVLVAEVLVSHWDRVTLLFHGSYQCYLPHDAPRFFYQRIGPLMLVCAPRRLADEFLPLLHERTMENSSWDDPDYLPGTPFEVREPMGAFLEAFLAGDQAGWLRQIERMGGIVREGGHVAADGRFSSMHGEDVQLLRISDLAIFFDRVGLALSAAAEQPDGQLAANQLRRIHPRATSEKEQIEAFLRIQCGGIAPPLPEVEKKVAAFAERARESEDERLDLAQELNDAPELLPAKLAARMLADRIAALIGRNGLTEGVTSSASNSSSEFSIVPSYPAVPAPLAISATTTAGPRVSKIAPRPSVLVPLEPR